ncbi:hypothetical protein Tco_1459039 [Tanacetum coccineum]
MVYKFIDEGKQEHEEMRAFISELRTTNELLFKERNNSLSKLRFEVYELSKVINNALMRSQGSYSRGGKTQLLGELQYNSDIHDKGPLVFIHDKPDAPKEVLIKNEPQKAKEQVVLPSLRPFLAIARAMIDVFNRKITLRVGDDEVIFDADQSIKRPTTEDDECYGIDDLDETINGLEKSINQADLESCDESGIDSYLGTPIRHIDPTNTLYLVTQETTRSDEVKSEHLYLASAIKIDEKKHKLKDLPHHLEYVYLYGDKYFPIIISSKLSEKEKMLLLQVLEKHKGAFAWKMSDIKGISPSFCTNKILIEDDFKPVIQPKGVLILNSWVSPIHVVPKKGGMTIVLNDNNELIPSRTVMGWRVCIDYHKLNDATRSIISLLFNVKC